MMAGPVGNFYTACRRGLSRVGPMAQGLVGYGDLAGGLGGGAKLASCSRMTCCAPKNRRPAVLRCLLGALPLAAALAGAVARGEVAQTTQHNDWARSGANLSETQLGTANVNPSQFGKLLSYTVDADVYAQPLVVPGVAIPGQGTRTVLYIASNNNSVYAFDADANPGANTQPLWQVNFNNPGAGVTPVPAGDVQSGQNIRNPGPIGGMGNPVIEPGGGTLYLVARTKENGSYVQRLHALDLGSGAEKLGGPKLIAASVAGSGYDSVRGMISFNAKQQNQRAALALANGSVYIAWASHEDRDPYHGWVMAYDAATLAQERGAVREPGRLEERDLAVRAGAGDRRERQPLPDERQRQLRRHAQLRRKRSQVDGGARGARLVCPG